MATMTLGQVYKILKENKLLKEIVTQDAWRHHLTPEEENISFDHISSDSRQVGENTLFVCKGMNFSSEFLDQAVKSGVRFYVTDRLPEVKKEACALVVTNSRKALAFLSFAMYDHPDSKLTVMAIGGTKGKTTTAYFLKNIMDRVNGGKTALLSTMETTLDGKNYQKSLLTTPESIDLAQMLAECVKNGMTHVVMETSSQAFKMDRVAAMRFSIASFLNISPDHIGENEHVDFEDYFYCKRQMFPLSDFLFLNGASDYVDFIKEELDDAGNAYALLGKDEELAYHWKEIDDREGLLSFSFKGQGMDEAEDFSIKMPGKFNLQNAAIAASMALKAGASVKAIREGLLATHVPGRMEVVERSAGYPIIVDYAHNRLSCEALCADLRERYPKAHLTLVIGAPGKRGLSRRKDFGIIIKAYMDSAILTAEDPADTDPVDIAKEIQSYCLDVPTKIIVDREEAIRQAIEGADENTLVILAGKGRDNYQEIGSERLAYKGDLAIAQEIVSALEKKK